ncbi:MAG: hypothetical protein QM661_03080 [Solimonas sp.]
MYTRIRHEPFLPRPLGLCRACRPAHRPGTVERLTLAMVVIGIVVGGAGIARALLSG